MLIAKRFVLLVFLAFIILFPLSDKAYSETGSIYAADAAGHTEKAGGSPSEFQEWMPEGRFFSVLVPSGWERREIDFMRQHDQYKVIMYAPGNEGIEYLTIDIAYYAEAVRTPEKFIYDLMNPLLKPQGEERGAVTDVVLSGRKAMSLEIKTPRSPPAGMEGKTIDTVKRYVVCPAEKGFYVLLYDSPTNISEENRWIFEKILNSFKPSVSDKTDGKRIREISDDEYKVFTDFFSMKKMPEIKPPEFFRYVVEGRTIYEKTLMSKKLEHGSLDYLKKTFGNNVQILIDDYERKNVEEYAIKDRILVPRLAILSEHRMKEIWGPRGPRSLSDVPFKELVYLSKVGFNSEKNAALFYVVWIGSLRTGYFVLMDKEDNKWVLKNAVMDSMIIY